MIRCISYIFSSFIVNFYVKLNFQMWESVNQNVLDANFINPETILWYSQNSLVRRLPRHMLLKNTLGVSFHRKIVTSPHVMNYLRSIQCNILFLYCDGKLVINNLRQMFLLHFMRQKQTILKHKHKWRIKSITRLKIHARVISPTNYILQWIRIWNAECRPVTIRMWIVRTHNTDW